MSYEKLKLSGSAAFLAGAAALFGYTGYENLSARPLPPNATEAQINNAANNAVEDIGGTILGMITTPIGAVLVAESVQEIRYRRRNRAVEA